MAIARQGGVVEVAGLAQVHLATFNHRLQAVFFNRKLRAQGLQSLHHRMGWLARKRLVYFVAPPSQFGLSDAWVGHFIDHIVDFAAERIKRGDRTAALRRQKQECVIKATPRRGGFLLNVFLGRHVVGIINASYACQ